MHHPCDLRLVAFVCAATLVGCQRSPLVGERAGAQAPSRGPELALVSASVSAGRVAVTYRLAKDGVPIEDPAAAALRPTFTLAALGTEPVTGVPAWRSLLLTGAGVAPSLPVAGPGTPAGNVLANARQPGVDAGGTTAALGDGTFTYTFGAALPVGQSLFDTLRVGAWLDGAQGSALTSATLDFVPAGGAPASRELVLDTACAGCHGVLRAHLGLRAGVRLCVTCHTWQSADPDTVDPAAAEGATAATNPNPLELGRLVHRIHRGKNLPTLHQASSAAAAPALPSATALPLPFLPGRNAAVFGRRFSVRAEDGLDRIFGRVASRSDNGQPARTVSTGVVFPRDYRDCEACHAGAADAAAARADEISRRACHGCHTDVWFETAVPPDPYHFAHPGGPQADETRCAGCHVSGTKVYAPLSEVHGSLLTSPHRNDHTVEIVEVRDFTPGKRPVVVFTVSDRNGPLDRLDAPTPAMDQAPSPSPLPRALAAYYGLSVTVAGPTSPDYRSAFAPGEIVPEWDYHVPLTLVPDAQGRFTYVMSWVVPDDASGTWQVGMESRKSATTVHYDTATDTFRWPYTGEAVTEGARNPVAFVNVTNGGVNLGTPAPRREVVSQENCDRCHQRLTFHGGLRNDLDYCLACHTPEATDWGKRPKDASGNVAVTGTYDGIEERSIHFKVMVHRIHTGGRTGAASIETKDPFVVYGMYGLIFFFDEGEFPGNLADCTTCHVGRTYEVESVPDDASPTVANETATVRHARTDAHVEGEPSIPPVQAACLSCHDAGATWTHAAAHTVGGEELCASCHGAKGAYSVAKVHGLPPAAP